MKTIDTATLFTDVAAVATTQPGKAAPPTGQGGENGGAFAKVLQVTSNSSAAATVASAAPADEAAPAAQARPARALFAGQKKRSAGHLKAAQIASQPVADGGGSTALLYRVNYQKAFRSIRHGAPCTHLRGRQRHVVQPVADSGGSTALL